MIHHMRKLALLGLFLALTSPCHAETISACGTVVNRSGCQVFLPYWGTDYGEYLLPDTLSVPYDTELRVTADVSLCSTRCSGWLYLYCMNNVTIGSCETEDLGCGVLGPCDEEYGCYAWTSLDTPADRLLLNDLQGFALGDSVDAYGIRAIIPSVCICGTSASLLHQVLVRCGAPPSPTNRPSWGTLRVLFRN